MPHMLVKELQLWLDGKYSICDYTDSAYTFMTWKVAIGNELTLRAPAKAAVGPRHEKFPVFV